MLVAGGYPDSYAKGFPIRGTDRVTASTVFHAGTRLNDGLLVTSGGRVLAVTSRGATMQEALDKSYSSVSEIYFEGMNYRKDIGFDLKTERR
jgi:phosphoribosylamine--glycine ligase